MSEGTPILRPVVFFAVQWRLKEDLPHHLRQDELDAMEPFARGRGQKQRFAYIADDAENEFYLSEQGLIQDTIPPRGDLAILLQQLGIVRLKLKQLGIPYAEQDKLFTPRNGAISP